MGWLLFFLFIGLIAAGMGIRIGLLEIGKSRHRRIRARWRLMRSQRRAR